jgi:hypothetical protein
MKSAHPEAHKNRSAAMTEVSARPEVAKGRSERAKTWWANASREERAQRVAAMHAADSRPEVKERRTASLKKTLSEPAAKAKRSALSTAMWANPESQKRMQAGRLKSAAALLASHRGATSKNAERADRAVRFRENYRLRHEKYPSWTATLREIDRTAFAAMSRSDRKDSAKKLRLICKYWGEKRFLPIGSGVAV